MTQALEQRTYTREEYLEFEPCIQQRRIFCPSSLRSGAAISRSDVKVTTADYAS